MFYDTFLSLCSSNGMKPGRAADEIGINRGTVTSWKKRGYTPRAEVLQRIADYFGVTVDYLLGKVSEPFLSLDEKGILQIDTDALAGIKEKPTPEDGDGLDPEQAEIVRLYEAAPPALRAAALAVLRSAEGQDKAPGGVSKAE